MEEWRPIKGYENIYIVSNYGNIRRLYKKHPDGKPLKPVIDKDGYYRVNDNGSVVNDSNGKPVMITTLQYSKLSDDEKRRFRKEANT